MKNQINVQHIKNYFSSKVVLALAITTLITISLGFCTSLYASFNFTNLLNSYLNSHPIVDDGSTESYILYSNTGNYSTYAIQLIFSLLPVIALFYMYFSSKSTNPKATPYPSFMYFFIISIISIVGAGFGILVCGIIFVVALALAGNSSSFDNAYDYDMAVTTSGILIIISLILFAVLIFNLITAILQTKFFNAPMKSMKSTNMVVTGKAYGVMNIINSVFNFIFAIAMALFGAIFLFFNDIENYASEFFTANSLSSIGILLIVIAFILVLSGVENILYGKLGFGYYKMASAVPRQPENNFNNYNGYNQQNYNNYNQPVQPQQPYGYNNYNQGYGQPEEAPQNPPQEQYNDNYNPYQQ